MSYQPPEPPPGQPPYPGYPAYPPTPPTSSKATTALILGILSLVACGPFTGIPAIIVGRGAKKEISESNGGMGGDGLATAGIITGIVGIAWWMFVLVLVVGVFVLGSVTQEKFEESCSTIMGEDSMSTDCEF